MPKTLSIDGEQKEIKGEANILEICRREGIDVPTFCYSPELSIYGSCRMCLVEIEGRGVQASCSTPPEEGMKILTNTEQIRRIRKINLELLLAHHPNDCLTCGKSTACKLQKYAKRFGVSDIRFKKLDKEYPAAAAKNVPGYAGGRVPKDLSSPSVMRDTSKCILCGSCVRACAEIQGVGALDFAFRGNGSLVLPAFGQELGLGKCIGCGQCAAVCPVGALMPMSRIPEAQAILSDNGRVSVAAIAPAVRVAIGEEFGLPAGSIATGKTITALKRLGFRYVFDICHGADFTIIEEATEFINRKQKGERLPQFTSCCPAWVKYVEQNHPDMIGRLSSCRSPMEMFGAFAKDYLPKAEKIDGRAIGIVAAMPCTAKKYEAGREEFAGDIDVVITTQELAQMIREAGIDFTNLPGSEFDKPFGVSTGAGVIFGASGGVTEAALRYAAEKITGKPGKLEFPEVRGDAPIRRSEIKIGGVVLRLACVSGIANAKKLLDGIRAGTEEADLIEVMACPGGCVNGGGQPYHPDCGAYVRKKRAAGLYKADETAAVKTSQGNEYAAAQYRDAIGEVGGHRAHELFHTHFTNKTDN